MPASWLGRAVGAANELRAAIGDRTRPVRTDYVMEGRQSMQDAEHAVSTRSEMMRKSCAVIFNPTKVDAEFSKTVGATLTGAGFVDVRWLETTAEDPGEAMTAEAIAVEVDLVVVAGGDGTVRAVASGLVGTGIPLGIVPAGTANLLARNLELPLEQRAALDVAVGGQSRSVDMVELTVDDGAPVRFAVMAGTGLDAMIMDEVDQVLKAKVGSAAYFIAAGKALGQLPIALEITIDGGRAQHREAMVCVIGNVGRLPGGMSLMPDARADDGLLHVYLACPRHVGHWLKALARLISRRPRNDDQVDLWCGREVEVRLDSSRSCQIDGDVIGEGTRLRAVVLPAALTVVVPEVGEAGRGVSEG